eukprot:786700-Pelagomonas_calceolata.AAC.4
MGVIANAPKVSMPSCLSARVTSNVLLSGLPKLFKSERPLFRKLNVVLQMRAAHMHPESLLCHPVRNF